MVCTCSSAFRYACPESATVARISVLSASAWSRCTPNAHLGSSLACPSRIILHLAHLIKAVAGRLTYLVLNIIIFMTLKMISWGKHGGKCHRWRPIQVFGVYVTGHAWILLVVLSNNIMFSVFIRVRYSCFHLLHFKCWSQCTALNATIINECNDASSSG